jgi:4-amino-4-deoxy-L-arabinose transferase-like glycosyltransferase
MYLISHSQAAVLETSAPAFRNPGRTRIAYATAAALLLRVVLIFVLHTYKFPASDHHYAFGFETGSIAASLATGGGFSSPFGVPTGPTTWIAPVYPALLAATFQVFGVFSSGAAIAILLLNSLFSALTVPVIYRIGRRVFDARSGEVAAWIWALVPFFARWPITWVWETALAALLCSVIFAYSLELEDSSWQPWAGLGLLWGVIGLTSPSLLGFLPISFLYPAWKVRRKLMHAFSRLALAAAVFLITISPWLARNDAVFHRAVFLRGNFWFEASISNFHDSSGEAWSGLHPAVNPAVLQHYIQVGEVEFVAEAKHRVFTFARSKPGEFSKLVAARAGNFWDGEELRYEPGSDPFKPWMVALTSVLAFGGLLWAFADGREWGLFAGLFLLFPIPYNLTYTNPRYRHPIEPMMVVLTGFLCVKVWDRYLKARA